jgi:TetR/AcrR family fatty acid metabolism transcriptional regulator
VIFSLGVESGEFRELSAESLGTAVRGAIGAVMFRSIADPEFDLDRYGEDLIDAFTRASRR